MAIEKAWKSLSDRLWDTPWCVNIGYDNLILRSHKNARPNRRSRKMRTWHGYNVICNQKSLGYREKG